MLLTAILAAALQTAPTPVPATPADPNKKICRTEKVTGSRVSTTRRCQTAAEWKAQEEENRAVYNWQREAARTQN